jgi:hypothetical protein
MKALTKLFETVLDPIVICIIITFVMGMTRIYHGEIQLGVNMLILSSIFSLSYRLGYVYDKIQDRLTEIEKKLDIKP